MRTGILFDTLAPATEKRWVARSRATNDSQRIALDPSIPMLNTHIPSRDTRSIGASNLEGVGR